MSLGCRPSNLAYSDYRCSAILNVVSSKAEFGQIPGSHWFQPGWIDSNKAYATRVKMEQDEIIYGGESNLQTIGHFIVYHIK